MPQNEAASLVGAFQRGRAALASTVPQPSTVQAFEQLLTQPVAAGIRIYRARHADGTPYSGHGRQWTLQGADLAGGDNLFAQAGQNCPPVCAAMSLAVSHFAS